MRTCCALFTPARADIATGAKIARYISKIFDVSPMPNQITIRGK
ncbi:hypothetical protein [Enterobacter hormaechei]|nr:hypothetical protein [Enterobacter hormaechei]